jgi:acetyltransferase
MAVMSNSGALRSLITEAAERTSATLATLSDATEASLAATLEQKKVSNPLDTIRTISEKQYTACLDALVDAPEVDIVLVAEDLPIDNSVDRRIGNLLSIEGISRRADGIGKTVAVFTPLLASPTDYGRAVRERIPHVPMLRGTDRALRIVSTLARAAARPLHSGPFVSPPADTELVRHWRQRAATLEQPTALNEVDSKALLHAFGIPLPPERLAETADDAVAAAQEIGFPIVLKAVSAALPHKSDAGLVCLNLTDADTVRQAAAAIIARTRSLRVALDVMLVAKQVTGCTEVVLGVQRDVEMGPVVMFGMGGVLIELFKDVSFAPATLDHDQAREMVRATHAGQMLTGFRGRKPGDIDALCDALVNLGRLARDFGDVIETIDVNPLLVREQGVVALDALVVLRPPSPSGDQ